MPTIEGMNRERLIQYNLERKRQQEEKMVNDYIMGKATEQFEKEEKFRVSHIIYIYNKINDIPSEIIKDNYALFNQKINFWTQKILKDKSILYRFDLLEEPSEYENRMEALLFTAQAKEYEVVCLNPEIYNIIEDLKAKKVNLFHYYMDSLDYIYNVRLNYDRLLKQIQESQERIYDKWKENYYDFVRALNPIASYTIDVKNSNPALNFYALDDLHVDVVYKKLAMKKNKTKDEIIKLRFVKKCFDLNNEEKFYIARENIYIDSIEKKCYDKKTVPFLKKMLKLGD